MSESILEKSLDDIIGEKKTVRKQHSVPSRRHLQSRVNKQARRPDFRGRNTFKPSNSIPEDIAAAAGPRPLLRVKNIHHELNGEDLSNLFSGVAPVEFIKFDPVKDTIAYVCFESNNNENNSIAISRFDGKKAMGKMLIVENATSLADRIIVPARNFNRSKGPSGPRTRPNRPAKRERPVKKSVDALDEELSAYMNGANES